MGLASSIFWIVLGILYILYKAFREKPGETIAGIAVAVVTVAGVWLWAFLFQLILSTDLVFLWILYGLATIVPLVIMVARSTMEENKRRADLKRRSDRYDEIVHSMEYSQEEFEAYLKKWRHGPSMAQIKYNLAKDPKEIAEGREAAFKDFALETGIGRRAWDQVYAEERARTEADTEE